MTPNYSYLFPRPVFPLNRTISVVNQISQWRSSNFLCLNSSKTELIIIGLSAKSRKFLTLQYTCPITFFPLLSPLMLLSAILVLFLILISLSNHISNLSRSCFMLHIFDLPRIRPMLDSNTEYLHYRHLLHRPF